MTVILEMLSYLGRCAGHQGGVKSNRNVCQLMERRDGYGGDVKVLGEV